MENTFVTLCDLPTSIRSYVVKNNDFTYTIFLNSKLNHEQHLRSYSHEVEHIRNGDYDKRNVDLIELSAHAKDS